MAFMRHHNPRQGYFGPAPSTYEPVSFGAPRKCRFWELLGDHAQQDDTAVVGVAIEHVYRRQADSGKMEECREDFVVSADGTAGFIDH